MPLCAIRTVHLFERRVDGLNVLEERVVAFQAASWVEDYADRHGMPYLEDQEGYEADAADGVPDGHEMWSQLFQSHESLEAFFASRYERYAFEPDA